MSRQVKSPTSQNNRETAMCILRPMHLPCGCLSPVTQCEKKCIKLPTRPNKRCPKHIKLAAVFLSTAKVLKDQARQMPISQNPAPQSPPCEPKQQPMSWAAVATQGIWGLLKRLPAATSSPRVLAWRDEVHAAEPLDLKLWVEDAVSRRIQWIGDGSGGVVLRKSGAVGPRERWTTGIE